MDIQTWQNLTIEQWLSITPEDWGAVFFADLEPMFEAVSLESLGFSQDGDFVYIPVESLGLPLSWSQLTTEQWLSITPEQWLQLNTETTLTAQQLFWLLILKLQAAQLPAHQVRITGNLAVVESRAWLVSEFNPDNY